MSDHAALLCRAAAHARETAKAATTVPWAIWDDLPDHGYTTVGDAQGVLTDELPFTEECNPVAHVYARHNATHIALWHPGVALAVAAWLESEAAHHADDPSFERGSDPLCDTWPHAVGIARALLGEDT